MALKNRILKLQAIAENLYGTIMNIDAERACAASAKKFTA
jgi:hypothetical protein